MEVWTGRAEDYESPERLAKVKELIEQQPEDAEASSATVSSD